MNHLSQLPAIRPEDATSAQILALLKKAGAQGYPESYLIKLTIQQITALAQGRTDA